MDGPITPAQKKYFYYHFRTQFDDFFDQITKYRASQFISDAERIYTATKDPVERQLSWNRLADSLRSELKPIPCRLCGKSKETVNALDYCNC